MRRRHRGWLIVLPAVALTAVVLAAPAAEPPPILVFIPDFEASALRFESPEPGAFAPVTVWGPGASPKDYLALRLPNQLQPLPLPVLNSFKANEVLAAALTSTAAEIPSFHPFKSGETFFVFPYDWRRSLNDEIAPALAAALVNYGRMASAAAGYPLEKSRFILIGHGLGALAARTLLSQRPRVAENLDRVILLAPPNLGTTAAVAALLTGSGTSPEASAAGILLPTAPALLPLPARRLAAVTFPSLFQLLPLRGLHWVKYDTAGHGTRVAEDDLLTIGTWKEFWPSAELERTLFLEPFLSRLASASASGDKSVWAYSQDLELVQLQKLLERTREWRLQIGTLGYTEQLLTRPGEASRLRVAYGTGLRTPTGLISEGFGDQTTLRFTFDDKADGDGIVPSFSATEDLENTRLAQGFPQASHFELPSHPGVLKWIMQQISAPLPASASPPAPSTAPPNPAPPPAKKKKSPYPTTVP